jgi:hypothetical protein
MTKRVVRSLDEFRQILRDEIAEMIGTRCMCGLGVDTDQMQWMTEGVMDGLEDEFQITFRSIGSELCISPNRFDGLFGVPHAGEAAA